jgi:hypothetical protein
VSAQRTPGAESIATEPFDHYLDIDWVGVSMPCTKSTYDEWYGPGGGFEKSCQSKADAAVAVYTLEERRRAFAADAIANWAVPIALLISVAAVLIALSPEIAGLFK